MTKGKGGDKGKDKDIEYKIRRALKSKAVEVQPKDALKKIQDRIKKGGKK